MLVSYATFSNIQYKPVIRKVDSLGKFCLHIGMAAQLVGDMSKIGCWYV